MFVSSPYICRTRCGLRAAEPCPARRTVRLVFLAGYGSGLSAGVGRTLERLMPLRPITRSASSKPSDVLRVETPRSAHVAGGFSPSSEVWRRTSGREAPGTAAY